MKVTLLNTDNVGYKYLEGKEGELSVDAGNNFVFTFKGDDGQDYALSSHIDGRLGEIGNAYRSPEVTFKTGICTFTFDQREKEVEKSVPSVVMSDDYRKLSMDFIAARKEYEKDMGNVQVKQRFEEAKATFDAVATGINEGKTAIVVDMNQYLDNYLKNGGDAERIDIIGRGSIDIQKIPCSDLTAISVNDTNFRSDTIVGVYSNTRGLEIEPQYRTLEDAIEKNLAVQRNENDELENPFNEPVM